MNEKSQLADRIVSMMMTGQGTTYSGKSRGVPRPKAKKATLPRDQSGRFLPVAPRKKPAVPASDFKWIPTPYIEKMSKAIAKKIEHPDTKKYFEQLGKDIGKDLKSAFEENRFRTKQEKMTDLASMVPLPDDDGEFDDEKYEEVPVPSRKSYTPLRSTVTPSMSSKSRRARSVSPISPGSTFHTPSRRPARFIPQAPHYGDSLGKSDVDDDLPLKRITRSTVKPKPKPKTKPNARK